MMKNDNRVESSIYIAFNAIISERKESTRASSLRSGE